MLPASCKTLKQRLPALARLPPKGAMAPFTLMLNQSTLSARPGTNSGVITVPKVSVSDFSAARLGLPPETLPTRVTGWTADVNRLACGTPCARQIVATAELPFWAAVARLPHGSLKAVKPKVWPPNSSPTLGAQMER